MVLVLYFQKGRLYIIIQISTISEHIANLTKEEEKVRECSEPSIVITFEPHTTSSEDSTMKEAATAILFAITVVSLFRSKDYIRKSLLKTSTFFPCSTYTEREFFWRKKFSFWMDIPFFLKHAWSIKKRKTAISDWRKKQCNEKVSATANTSE